MPTVSRFVGDVVGSAGKKSPLTPVPATSGVIVTGTRPPARRGLVALWSPNMGVSVAARHVEAPQVIQERAGGWQPRDRPGQIPRTWRPGSGQLLKIRLVLLLDGYSPPKRSVQPEIDVLRRMGYRDSDRGDARIVIVGAVPYADGGLQPGFTKTPPDWVLDRLDIVEELHTSAGSPCRAVATVELLEYVEGDTKIRRLKSTRARKEKWQKGDTLATFAKRHLGAASRAQLIRKANPKISKWSAVRGGTLIVVPGLSSKLED